MPLDGLIELLSERLLKLDTGDLAELRRMEIGGAGPMAYWRLAAECGFLDSEFENWMRIVQILAILTPKGDRKSTDRLHDPGRPLGRVFCDGGDPDWKTSADSRPFVSETRLARLLAAPILQREEALTRFARMLAAKRDRASGVNCVEIAALLLFSNPERNQQNLARAYYRRLNSARPKAEQEDARK